MFREVFRSSNQGELMGYKCAIVWIVTNLDLLHLNKTEKWEKKYQWKKTPTHTILRVFNKTIFTSMTI